MTDYYKARSRFASQLRALRQEKGMTQEQLAELIGKTTEHISFLERAERPPSFEVLFDIAQVLGVAVAVLVDQHDQQIDLATILGIAPLSGPLPDPVLNSIEAKERQLSDIKRLNTLITRR